MSYLNILLSILFPKTCISCKDQGTHLCQDCLATISINSELFPIAPETSLSGLLAATSLKEPLIRKALRYYKNPPFLRDLSSQFTFLIISHLVHSRNKHLLEDAVCIAMPTKHQKWRGFNPAQEIAKQFSLSLNIPLVSIKNMPSKKILLIDDIYETGATMEDTASTLKAAGAKEVWGVVVARGEAT